MKNLKEFSALIFILVLSVVLLYGLSSYNKTFTTTGLIIGESGPIADCWTLTSQEECNNAPNCQWKGESISGWCERPGCWDYNNETSCNADSNCEWKTDEHGSWCQEIDCSGFSTKSTCEGASCLWKSSGWCEEEGCWSYWNNETACNQDPDCQWDTQGNYCYEPGPWDYHNQTSCEGAGYTWKGEGFCKEPGCWNYWNETSCNGDPNGYGNCQWDSQGNYCYEIGCWDMKTPSDCLAMENCGWDNYSMSCYEIGCWDYNNETACNQDPDCQWDPQGNYCYEPGPWDYHNQTSCEGANFTWENNGWCEEEGCWNYWNETSCNGDPNGYGNCKWDSQGNYCYEEPPNCWNYSDSSTCLSHSGEGCTWKDQGGWCEKPGCWDYDSTDQSTCESVPGCVWNSPWCQEKDCGTYIDNSTCMAHADQGCSWKTHENGWCEEIMCSNFDNNKTACLAANETIGKNCVYDDVGGWCYEEVGGCSDFNGDENGCYNTMWCVWTPSNQTCEEPVGGAGGGGAGAVGPTPTVNPACWAFDYSQADCEKVNGCTWSGECNGNEENGVQCENITDQNLCENIPFLSTCCAWEAGECKSKPGVTTCWDNMQPPPEGAMFCDDYNAVGSETVCEQIAGSPWFMPCKWNNETSRCEFKNDRVFGGGTGGFEDISTKKNCEFAGGVWKTEQWYDEATGTMQTDTWCEMGFGTDYETCDSACWACEFRDNGSSWSNKEEARTACEGSNLGFCEFYEDTHAPNGYGWCKMKDDMMYGATSCSKDCWSCFSKDDCEASSAGCKWFTDYNNPSRGWCDLDTVKSCSEDCWQCFDENSCENIGLGGGGSCTWDSNNYYCKPSNFDNEICFDGIDNDNNGMTDCADPYCMFDPFCGGNMISDCGKYTTESTCTADQSGNCIWIEDSTTGASWCGMKGENCWMFKSNSTGCDATDGCRWVTSDKGFCDINESKTSRCFNLVDKANCIANSDCRWIDEPWSPNGGTCDSKLFKCNELDKSSCGNGEYTYCAWIEDPFSPQGGRCDVKCFSDQYNPEDGSNASCTADSNCVWIYGRCEPEAHKMEECFKYDGNETGCNEQTACAWHSEEGGGRCDVDKSKNCPQYQKEDTCEGAGCAWMTDEWGNSWCDNEFFTCFQYDGTNKSTCEASGKCTWSDGENICDPLCFNESLDESGCNAIAGCKWASGYCDPKVVGEMFGGMESGAPVMLGKDKCPESIDSQVDICGFGIKEMPESYGLGITVEDISEAAVCNGEQTFGGVGSCYEPTKFYWYLDTDGNKTDNCNSKDGSETGFEFFIKYESEWKDGGLSEVKVAYKCVDGEWAPTPIKLSSWKKKMCDEIGGGMIAIDKAALKKFTDLFDVTKDMRIYATTASATGDASSPVDSIGPVYYTPGSVDFKFEDCTAIGVDMDGDGFTSENDPDCQGFKRFGFQPFEFDCSDGVDNNGDGLVDCNDPMCAQTPICGGDFNFEGSTDDKKAPKVTFQKVDTFYDGAFVSFDTDEPANGTLFFYYKSSNCIADGTHNRTLIDIGDPTLDYDDYKPFHGIMIDNFKDNPNKLGYDLENGTSYYYKYKVCDPSGNCGISACMNFTTESTRKEFLFKIDTPSGFPPPMLGDMNMSGGKKINETEGKLKDIVINCPTNGYSLKFVGVSVKAAKTFNLSSIVCDASDNLIGMNSQVWNDIVATLNPQSVVITWAIGGNGATVYHCDEDGTNCKDVTTYLNCNVTSSSVSCEIPVTLGFSTYKVNTSGGETTTTVSGGGGGGGGAGTTTTVSGETTTTIGGAVTTTVEETIPGEVTTTVKGGISPEVTQREYKWIYIVAVIIVIIAAVGVYFLRRR